jgi:hypothetical protein
MVPCKSTPYKAQKDPKHILMRLPYTYQKLLSLPILSIWRAAIAKENNQIEPIMDTN